MVRPSIGILPRWRRTRSFPASADPSESDRSIHAGRAPQRRGDERIIVPQWSGINPTRARGRHRIERVMCWVRQAASITAAVVSVVALLSRGNTFTVGDRIRMGGVRGDVIALTFM